MQFFTNTHIQFLKYRKVFVWLSLSLLVIAVAELMFLGGLNFGIDFVGGTQLTLKLRDADQTTDDIRNSLTDAGLREALIQQYGPVEEHEILIKTPVKENSEEGTAAEVLGALNSQLNGDLGNKMDLNQRGRETIADALLQADPDGMTADADAARNHYEAVAGAIVAKRQELKLFKAFEEVTSVEGVTPATAQFLQANAGIGAFQVLSSENVGPQIGSELRTKGYLAVIMSLLGMLAYIWFRFELRFGIGALVAVFHDFLITVGLFAISVKSGDVKKLVGDGHVRSPGIAGDRLIFIAEDLPTMLVAE